MQPRAELSFAAAEHTKLRLVAGAYRRPAEYLTELLDRGLEITFEDGVKSGFQIRPRDGSYKISFEEEDFVSFFREFLRERTRRRLFPSDDSEKGGSPAEQTGQGR